jgi:hypothetical protein
LQTSRREIFSSLSNEADNIPLNLVDAFLSPKNPMKKILERNESLFSKLHVDQHYGSVSPEAMGQP